MVLTLTEREEDPFFRACLLEMEFEEGCLEIEDQPARLEQVFAAYLAAGDYRGGAFSGWNTGSASLLLSN